MRNKGNFWFDLTNVLLLDQLRYRVLSDQIVLMFTCIWKDNCCINTF